jgi:Icc-related predicted phosphoesterase
MRIIAISDTHSMHRQLTIPECDVLIFAGDMCGMNVESEVVDFNNWLGEQPVKHRIVIAGNHDYPLYAFSCAWNRKVLSNVIYLENSEVVIDGIKFWGSPITPTFMEWWFMANRGDAIKKYWDMIPSDTNVLITHGPAYNILDLTELANGDPGDHVGCFDLLQKIKQLEQLKLHCFGHIHSGYGIFKQEGIQFINASSCDENYNIVNKPIEVEI